MLIKKMICERCGSEEKHQPDDDGNYSCQRCARRDRVKELLIRHGLSPDEDPPYTEYEERLKKEADNLRARISELHDLQIGIGEELEAIIVFHILEEGFLKRIRWRFWGGHILRAVFSDEEERRRIEDLNDLFVTFDHCHITLMPEKVALHYDDGEVSLKFKEMKLIMPYVVEWGIEVDFSMVTKQKEELMSKIKELDELVKVFKLDP